MKAIFATILLITSLTHAAPPGRWEPIPLDQDWTAHAHEHPAFTKDKDGWVSLRGIAFHRHLGNTTEDTRGTYPIGALPPDARPSQRRIFPVASVAMPNWQAAGAVTIWPDGTIYATMVGVALSLDGIRYQAP